MISAIRDGIQTRLQTIDGLRCYDTMPASITPPVAIVLPGNPLLAYNSAFGGTAHTLNFLILLVVGKVSERTAQDLLDAYLDPSGASSVKAAVDGTLGDLVDDANVTQVVSYGPVSFGQVDYLGAQVAVEVMV